MTLQKFALHYSYTYIVRIVTYIFLLPENCYVQRHHNTESHGIMARVVLNDCYIQGIYLYIRIEDSQFKCKS